MHKTFLFVITSLLAFTTAHTAEFFVDKYSADPQSPFQSWENAAIDIQDAIDAASEGDTILIAPGVYTKPEGSTRDAVAFSTKLLHLIGIGGCRDDVIIDGGGQYRGIYFHRAARVYDHFALIKGMTIRNGFAAAGGGIFAYAWNTNSYGWRLEIEDCAVISNTATGRGGGFGYYRAGPIMTLVVSNCLFSGNSVLTNPDASRPADYIGGALDGRQGEESVIEIYDSVFTDNRSPTAGGINMEKGVLLLRNTQFTRNVSDVYGNAYSGGGAVYINVDAWFDARNCLFNENSTVEGYDHGGAFTLMLNRVDATNYIRNCTFWGNKSRAIYQRSWTVFPALHMYNSIFYNNDPVDVYYANKPQVTNRFYNCSFSSTNFSFNLVAENLIEGDPKFIDPEGGDFRLRGSSPAAGTGLYESWMDDAFDLDGNPRITPGMGVDMGAYAFRSAGTIFLIR